MRRLISFTCDGATLVGALDEGDDAHGLLIVTGGSDVRWGSHRLFERLAREIAAQGHPVFRFDRRGVGDSDGDDPGYAGSGPDIAAALAQFRRLCPKLERVAGFGLCDGATALAVAAPTLDGLVLANPWLVEPQDGMPPQAAIRRRYAAALTSGTGWRRLLGGAIDYRKAARGAWSLASRRESRSLAQRVLRALDRRQVCFVLASGDATAQAAEPLLGSGRDVVTVETSSHSFAGAEAFEALVDAVTAMLRDHGAGA
jgi:exosortase A-associated hydrolase 1